MSVELKNRIITSFFLVILLFLIFSYKLVLVYSLIILSVLSILEFLAMSSRIISKKIYLLAANFTFIIYVYVFCLFFFYFSNFYHLQKILLIFLFGCIASDIGGFIFGKLIKGPKLTKISPKKTIAGSIGSIFLTVLVMTCLMLFFTNSFKSAFFLLALVTSVGCQIGDLFFSYLKRKAKLKDTGKFLPGHGGVLDRLDGIFFGLPIGLLYLVLFY
tara:strand:- start:144 stop:791 length:648 start_codon:yes stop_codon:yes gene_type:complete